MEKKQLPLALLAIIVIMLMACSKTEVHTDCSPKRYDCELDIVNSKGISLVGENCLYKPDSIYMLINGFVYPVFIESSRIRWDYSCCTAYNGANYLLHLSSTVVDTLQVVVKSRKVEGECAGFDYSIERFTYNGKQLLPRSPPLAASTIFSIIKE